MGEQRTVCFALVALALAGPAAAGKAEFGTAQEAQAMLARAIAEVNADRRAAIAKFKFDTSAGLIRRVTSSSFFRKKES